MNFLRVSFTAASRKTFRRNANIMIRGFATAARNLESEQVVEKMNRRDDFVTYNTLMINDMSKVEELSRADQERQAKRLSPNKTTYQCLIDCFCKQDRFDVAHRVLNDMIVSGFSPSYVTLNDIFRGFIRTGDIKNAYEMSYQVKDRWMDDLLSQCLSDEVTYTSLVNAYIDEGKWDKIDDLSTGMGGLDKHYDRNGITHICTLPESVIDGVFINGLDNKARTTQTRKALLKKNYSSFFLIRPILEFHLTLAKNCSYDEFESLVELVYSFCDRDDLENACDTMLKSNYHKPDGIDDGIVYNLFVIAHCKRHNIDEAYNTYKEMVHHGFACHMFTVLILIKALSGKLNGLFNYNKKDINNELLWVIQNVLRSCNVNDSEIVNYLNEINLEWPMSEAIFDVLAEKAKDGLFLKCSYSPPSA